jgi:quercetin dioxygenase-like cupin family protein
VTGPQVRISSGGKTLVVLRPGEAWSAETVVVSLGGQTYRGIRVSFEKGGST